VAAEDAALVVGERQVHVSGRRPVAPREVAGQGCDLERPTQVELVVALALLVVVGEPGAAQGAQALQRGRLYAVQLAQSDDLVEQVGPVGQAGYDGSSVRELHAAHVLLLSCGGLRMASAGFS
jgi:hypothetical protein